MNIADSSMLRQLWSLVEATQASILLKLDDTNLVQRLLKQLSERQTLNCEEVSSMSVYIQSRILLIRELAQERLATDP